MMSAVRLRRVLSGFWLVVLLAAGALALVTWWLLAGGISRDEALKTGGLAAGAFVALYALWLNDRRRRTEEERREIERNLYAVQVDRTELDRERAADERFARAVDLLGSDADQVRVGAMHALAGLARDQPRYTQTVLDVLCSYLRRPFDHYRYAEIRHDKDRTWDRADQQAADREQQVRRTAQQLITDLLPSASTPDAPRYNLDLHAATLEYFDIAGKVVGELRVRQTNLYEANTLRGTQVYGPAWFTAARCWGRLRLPGAVFHQQAWFSRCQAEGEVSFAGVRFSGETKFATSEFSGPVSFHDAQFVHPVDFSNVHFQANVDLRVSGGAVANTYGMKVSLGHEVQLPEGWVLDKTHGPTFGLVRA
jgi:Pentapeptide repeats (9 copies)